MNLLNIKIITHIDSLLLVWYDNNMKRNVERNRRLFEYYHRENDKHGATYEDVAKVFNISPSRAWRIVNAEHKRLVEINRRKILLENA